MANKSKPLVARQVKPPSPDSIPKAKSAKLKTVTVTIPDTVMHAVGMPTKEEQTLIEAAQEEQIWAALIVSVRSLKITDPSSRASLRKHAIEAIFLGMTASAANAVRGLLDSQVADQVVSGATDGFGTTQIFWEEDEIVDLSEDEMGESLGILQ